MSALNAKKQKGQVIIILAISMVILIGAVGIAVDSGLGYMVKARLNAAVDSAAAAAARAVSRGNDQAVQEASARQAARRFFAANYPNGYLGSTPTLNEPTVRFDEGRIAIDISAQAVLPVTFMRVMGFKQLNVNAASRSVRKDLDLAFVMDASGSLSSKGANVKSSAISFLEKFSPTTDRVALIHFAHGAVVDDPIRAVGRGFNRSSMNTHINAFIFDGSADSPEGLRHARAQLDGIAPINRSGLRTIVFFSGGSRNANRASGNLIEAMAGKLRDEGIYVFTVGLGPALLDESGPDNETGEDLLKCMANTRDSLKRCYRPDKPVGLYCYAGIGNDLNPCFSKLAAEISRLAR